ncbi:MAG: hypothetical protein ACI9Y7_002117 [Dokdonia sp.]|jgi:hypothetical protein
MSEINWHKSKRENWHSLIRNHWHHNSEITGTNRTEVSTHTGLTPSYYIKQLASETFT